MRMIVPRACELRLPQGVIDPGHRIGSATPTRDLRAPLYGCYRLLSGRTRRTREHPHPTPMHRSQLCAARDSGCAISPMRTARTAQQLLRIVFYATSIRAARYWRLLISGAPRGPSSSRACSSTRNSRKAPQMPALLRADRRRLRHRIDRCCRERQQVMEIAHCVSTVQCGRKLCQGLVDRA